LPGGLKSTPKTDDKHLVANVFSKNGLKTSRKLPVCLLAGVMLAGCGGGGFDPNGILESRPVRLDGEQVILIPEQVDCGAHEDLWNIAPLGDGRAIARLTQKGRDLQFSDDVQIGDPAIGSPYAQIHGSFPLKVIQPGSSHDEDAVTKLANAKVGVAIDHSCFRNSPPVLMGIHHGKFDQSTNPIFRFKLENEWLVDQVIH